MRLEQCSLRQRTLPEKKLQSTQCQTYELDTTPLFVGQLRCVQAKIAPERCPLQVALQGRSGGLSLTPFYR